MEILTAATAAISSAAGAVSGAVSSVAGAVGLSGGSSALFSALGGVGTLVSAMGAIREGDARATALEQQAADARVDAQQASLEGLQQRSSLKRQLVQALGERDVAYAASGVDLSFGTPAAAREQQEVDAERALSLSDANADLKRNRLLERASSYMSQAGEARRAGSIKAAGSVLSGAYAIGRKG